jgi:hypothetical protein
LKRSERTGKSSKRGAASRRLWATRMSSEGFERKVDNQVLTGQAHGADVANIDNLAVAEACRSKVDLILSRLGEMLARRGSRKEGHLARSHELSSLANRIRESKLLTMRY